jgi:hypothetical protein
MDGNEIEAVELTGDVELQLVDFRVRAEGIEYLRELDRIYTVGATVVTSPELELRGRGLSFDLPGKSLRVDSNVELTLKPAAADSAAGPPMPTKDPS